MCKCKCENPTSVKMGNELYEVDPCIYEEIEYHHNVTVIVSKCKKCGNIDISWRKEE